MSKKLTLVETDVGFLHQSSQEVDLGNLDLVNMLEAELLNVFRKMQGKMQGLAAIQVGKPYKAILLRYVKGEDPIVVYNPKILFSIGKVKSIEGCMSEGDSRYLVWRPALALVSYTNKYRETKKEWLPYKKARIFAHEVDHLSGILLQDKGKLVEA